MKMHRVAFGLGANLGDAAGALQGAVDFLNSRPELNLAGVSSRYRTTPVGGPSQPDYWNAVVVADSAAAPMQLLALAHQVEERFGRTREVRWGPRTLDVDLLAVGDLVWQDPALTLPHPRAHLRAFVLVPWAEVDPDFEVPGAASVRILRDALPEQDLQEVAAAAAPDGSTWWVQTVAAP